MYSLPQQSYLILNSLPVFLYNELCHLYNDEHRVFARLQLSQDLRLLNQMKIHYP